MTIFIAAIFIGTLVMAYKIGKYEDEHLSKDK